MTPQKSSYPQKIIFLKPPKNIEIQNLTPPPQKKEEDLRMY